MVRQPKKKKAAATAVVVSEPEPLPITSEPKPLPLVVPATSSRTRSSARLKVSSTTDEAAPRASDNAANTQAPNLKKAAKKGSGQKRQRADSELQISTAVNVDEPLTAMHARDAGPQQQVVRTPAKRPRAGTRVNAATDHGTKSTVNPSFSAPDISMDSDNDVQVLHTPAQARSAKAPKKTSAGRNANRESKSVNHDHSPGNSKTSTATLEVESIELALDNAFLEDPESDTNEADQSSEDDEDESDGEMVTELSKPNGGRLAERFAAERPRFVSQTSQNFQVATTTPAQAVEPRTLPPRLTRKRDASAALSHAIEVLAPTMDEHESQSPTVPTTSEPADATNQPVDIELQGPNLKKISQKKQHPTVCATLELATQIYAVWACRIDGMANANARAPAISDALASAAKHLKYDNIFARVQTDSTYTSRLAYVPSQRWTVARGNLKALAAAKIVEAYNLDTKDPEVCRQQVKMLVSRPKTGYPYIFAGDSTSRPDKFVPNLDKPYLHPFIVKLLKESKEIGSGRKPWAIALQDELRSERPNEPILMPCPLLAVVATAIHAALLDYQTGTFGGLTGQAGEFKVDAYLAVYKDHMNTLAYLKTAPNTRDMYEPLLAKLWRDSFGVTLSESAGRLSHAEDLVDASQPIGMTIHRIVLE
ncbi:hypothetical protein BXZ70DRAFT_1006147 [Cristinia sonorae]|uniref:DUF6532 domain-containing protein n=1 Tax=Cristinia sonorae TaxID=1940300 RepID=A0A8K0XRV7_9AGAR|nr:hypothetical protein BXZ70DRAFT_1006147 [Cristinia sonorae]